AMSSGVPMRPTTRLPRMRFVTGLSGAFALLNSGVDTGPGAIALTVIQSGPSASASDLVSPMIADFVAEYIANPALPSAAREEMFTIRPTLDARIRGMT